MKKTNKILLAVSLILCLVSIIFAGAIQTDFGKIDMVEISLETEAGTLTGYMFRPKTATAETPAPAIVCSHGYLNNREMQDANYVELARRGYVVIAMNAYAHGDSEVAQYEGEATPQVKSGGMIEFVDYLATLPYVDRTEIGVTGHSMGGGYTITTMTYYTELERAAYEELVKTTSGAEARRLAHEKNLINTGVPVGNYPSAMAQNENGETFLCHCGVILARWDEFFAANALGMLSSDNTKALIQNLTGETVTAAEHGKVYTGKNGYTICFYSPAQYHATNHFSVKECRYLVETFNRTMPAPNPIPATDQVWWLKEGFNCLGLIGFFLFIVPFIDFLLSTSLFSDLRKDPELIDAKDTKKFVGKGIWHGILCFLILLPLLLIGYLLLINPVWPQDTTGGIGLWSVGCGLVALLSVKHALKKDGRKLKDSWEELGVKIGWKKFGKTLLLATLVVCATYALVFLADGINRTDFRIWSFDIRVFTLDKVWVAIRYLPFFAMYYIFASLAASQASFKQWSEGKQMLVVSLFNIIPPVLMLAITYLPTIFLDQTLWVALFNGSGGAGELLMGAFALIPILMIPFVPILAIASCISVRSYRLTGSIWLGGLVNTMLITMITVANTSFTYPY